MNLHSFTAMINNFIDEYLYKLQFLGNIGNIPKGRGFSRNMKIDSTVEIEILIYLKIQIRGHPRSEGRGEGQL